MSHSDKSKPSISFSISFGISWKSSLLSFVRILKEKLGIEKCLKDYGVDFETFKREIPSMLSDIKKDICTIYNPNKLSDEEYIRLLLKIYFGE